MKRIFLLCLFFALIFATFTAMSAVSAPISVGIACNTSTSDKDKIFFPHQKYRSATNPQLCVERHGLLTKLIVNKINLRYSEKFDFYVLILWIDNKGSDDLKKLTSSNLNRYLVILKDNNYINEGMIGGPLDKGVITIFGLDESTGKSLGDEIAGKHGYSSSGP
jgi:hypothetical protein